MAAEEVLSGAWRLGRKEDSKNIWIQRDVNEEERVKMSKLWKQAQEKNEARMEEEKTVIVESQGHEDDKVDEWKKSEIGVRN